MTPWQNLLVWLLKRTGINPASQLPPSMQLELAQAHKAAAELADRLAYIDAMAKPLLGVSRKDTRRDAHSELA